MLAVGALYGFVRLIFDAVKGDGPARWVVAWPWGMWTALRNLERQPCTCATSSAPCPRHGNVG